MTATPMGVRARWQRVPIAAVPTALVSAFLVLGMAAAHPGGTTRVSVSSAGEPGNGSSSGPAVSADGRYVAFVSSASNLVPGDTNGLADVFVYDRQTGATTRVSVATDGTQGNNISSDPTLSADGRYVAFWSPATTLVAGEATGGVFVHDRQTGTTERVSVATGGAAAGGISDMGGISADGRYVAFSSNAALAASDTNGTFDIYVHDRETDTTTIASISTGGATANDQSHFPTISADGRYVAFNSSATNLVDGDTNGMGDVFVHDRHTAATTRVSVASDGTQGDYHSGFYTPSLSADGRHVAFQSVAANLVPGDTNRVHDVFVHDRQTGLTTRVSVASGGGQAINESANPSLSGDGRFVGFHSLASNLVPGDTNAAYDAFVHDRQTATTVRVSVSGGGVEGNEGSSEATVTADGRHVAFASQATNLVPGDANASWDVFVHDLHALHFVNDTPLTDIAGTYFEHEIVWLYQEAITRGCNDGGTLFCPTATVTRQQMASFLVRALDLPPPAQDHFVDDEGSIHEDDINSLYEAGVTHGCGTDEVNGGPSNLLYCPTAGVTRAEMASFIARALTLPDPPAGIDHFDDDDGNVFHENDINKMAEARITLGCADRLYCPSQTVTREQMAAFLYRALPH